jgi:hypothetical protein
VWVNVFLRLRLVWVAGWLWRLPQAEPKNTLIETGNFDFSGKAQT